eukprot:9125337-Pyramimonas_sp.AAC.1
MRGLCSRREPHESLYDGHNLTSRVRDPGAGDVHGVAPVDDAAERASEGPLLECLAFLQHLESPCAALRSAHVVGCIGEDVLGAMVPVAS